MFSMKDCSLKRSCFRSFSWRIRLWQHGEKRRSALCTTWPRLRQHTWMMRGWFRCHAIAISMPIGFNVEICADLCFVADSGTSGNQFSVCKTESIVGNRFLTLSVRIPYLLELILVRSDDLYIRSLQMISIRCNRPYILKHNISPGNIYRNIYGTNVPYHIPCHIIFPPHRAITPYHRHKYLPLQRTISHTVPCIISTTPCHHTIPPTYHITYRAAYHTRQYHTTHTIPNQKYPLTWRQKIHTNSKIKILTKDVKKMSRKAKKWISGTRLRYEIQSKLS